MLSLLLENKLMRFYFLHLVIIGLLACLERKEYFYFSLLFYRMTKVRSDKIIGEHMAFFNIVTNFVIQSGTEKKKSNLNINFCQTVWNDQL